MAPIMRRPRAALCAGFLLSLAAAACSLVKPVENTAEKQAQARDLAAQGKHAEAARAFEELAAEVPAEHDSYDLLSAEQWVAAGRVAEARQAYAAVSPEARTRQAVPRALVAAEIAAAAGDGAGAAHELEAIGVPDAAELAQNYWYLRGFSAFLLARPVDGARAFIERERYLTAAGALRASREELFGRLRGAAARGEPLKPPPNADSVLAGWLQSAPVALELDRNALHAAAALDNWRRLFPNHPAGDSVTALALQHQNAVAAQVPDQIALLLPLSGRGEAIGVAVRDGFVAAYLESAATVRPRLKIYDVAAEPVATALPRALADGATFVVGPLTKEDVAALAPLAAGRVPVLALNYLADATAAPADFYQFALLPEDEARGVARRLAGEGKLKGVTLVPEGEWGSRVAAAFADELALLGGAVLDTGRYVQTRADFSEVIRRTLQVRGGKGEPGSHRGDAAFVFAAGTPAAERLMVSQLKFHFAGDIPVYATSEAFEPDPAANGDLDGLNFPDMPWMVAADPETARVRDAVRGAWPTRTARRDRLYAFGFDAYRLVPAVRGKSSLVGAGVLAGVTGRLRLDDRNRVHRELDWAQIKGGIPIDQ